MDPASLLPEPVLRRFCAKWRVRKLEVFGSAARGELRPGSDLDLLVTFDEDARWGIFEHMEMQDELSVLAGRPVDLVSRRAIERTKNEYRRRLILGQAKPLYAA